MSLGVHSLAAGDQDVVAVSRWTSTAGYVIADAIRITEAAAGSNEWSLPVPDNFFPRSEYGRTHHTYPAIDLRTPTGTPARAVRAGTVTRINDGSCGRGISLAGTDGATYNYCHFSDWSVSSGTSVTPGQQIGLTGNTGHSTGPHLHLQIRTPDGLLRCPQRLLLAIYDGVTPPAANALPTSGCTH
ncbi:peptidoglycan DD-metalloendopeptidase family protein [Phytoactinopolyspora alkaliphila]|uniref:Peptidoglycan DD-metalloendopeptidase family protein n=1 Tax=Phytoactinopolyspora alkaliphila TaxID=1783498 RepID=A0A6N9YIV2_9ACTN|nr:peptidoglycan DD-metalloendopeptidase family protein [Phytoactinopolyspora alkaliphila]